MDWNKLNEQPVHERLANFLNFLNNASEQELNELVDEFKKFNQRKD